MILRPFTPPSSSLTFSRYASKPSVKPMPFDVALPLPLDSDTIATRTSVPVTPTSVAPGFDVLSLSDEASLSSSPPHPTATSASTVKRQTNHRFRMCPPGFVLDRDLRLVLGQDRVELGRGVDARDAQLGLVADLHHLLGLLVTAHEEAGALVRIGLDVLPDLLL